MVRGIAACGAPPAMSRRDRRPLQIGAARHLQWLGDLGFGCRQCRTSAALRLRGQLTCGVAMVPAGSAAPCGCRRASSVASVCRSTISAAFRSGIVPEDGGEPAASEASRNRPDFWKADSDVAAIESGVERRLLRQHVQHRLLQPGRQIAAGDDRGQIGEQRRLAALLGRGLGRGDRDGDLLRAASGDCGAVPAATAQASGLSTSEAAAGVSVT